MPTQHIEPECAELLQDVADSLLKSRKVVVVTGAGISTNSGIPDFRSENGLYSLIQAQFDAAARQPREESPSGKGAAPEEDSDTDGGEEEPPAKRRKMSSPAPIDEPKNEVTEIEVSVKVETVRTETTIAIEPALPAPVVEETSITVESSSLAFSTPRARRTPLSLEQIPTSPLSSPPPEEAIVPPSVFRSSRLSNMAIPYSSSPLSSPPPNLFDPFCPSSPSNDGSSRRSSTSPSEVDDTPNSSLHMNPFSASQSSNSGKTTLPNMKGKDLFDASIWTDPLRTSVFYTFATTLRKKIRDVQPTSSHRFISHLRDRGKLVRCYTQNIDQIEEKVGLSTTLHHGPGSRGRFSRRSTASSQLSKMVEEVTGTDSKTENPDSPPPSQPSQDSTEESAASVDSSQDKGPAKTAKPLKSELPKSGVECVFLHGSLEQLRCFLCGRVCSWDDDQREQETMSGQQPECPHCAGATAAREERGKRALGVGKLRPDIVLYGEEHPNAHLISPIVTHDLALCPDMLLILGTSLRVHGLKIMVREFAKAVHAKGGKVVFVNFTKPPESIWGDIIDYWVQWDCDAWVSDLQDRIPKLWLPPEPPRARKKRDSGATNEDGSTKPESKKPPPANPVALRDTKVTGAYQTLKIVDELHRITGEPERPRRASLSATKSKSEAASGDAPQEMGEKAPRRPRARGPRKSAPGNLERPKKLTSSTLNPDHGRPQRTNHDALSISQEAATVATPNKKDVADSGNTSNATSNVTADGFQSSILDSVKKNARTRKRKKIDGVEVVMPTVGSRRTSTAIKAVVAEDLKLAPIRADRKHLDRKPGDKLQVMEPKSPPPGPLASISPNMRSAKAFGRAHSFYMQDALVNYGPVKPFEYTRTQEQENTHRPGPGNRRSQVGGRRHTGQSLNVLNKNATSLAKQHCHRRDQKAEESVASKGSRLSSAEGEGVTTRASQQLRQWGSNWNCAQQ
ncbi:hypothetical protein NLU13_3705 [Sarocladium strictum]|uniref:Deacetylase sirtuin-type domain-containing protein n=1 Tax=Sarocladium strictum TaxID=5046 RepID=A0AA39GQ98_SARSR|nr:hypothetical protein NLU13_3705 [Sarocladium strictum]